MWKKILTVSLALAMVLSLAACAKEPSAQEIVDGVIEALDDIRTYQFDIDETRDMAGEAEGEAFEWTMVTDSSGALDIENRQMRMDMTRSMAMTGQDEMESEMEMYLIGNIQYVMEIPEMGPMWIKSEMPEEYWEEMSPVEPFEPQIELLEAAQVEVIGSETVGGIDCYVLQLTPDLEQLWQMFMGQVPTLTEELLEEVFRSFSVKQWIAKDTYFLAKAEMDMAMELTPEAMGSPEEEGVMAMDYAMTFLGYDYNQPVSIVLPPEAEEAVEASM